MELFSNSHTNQTEALASIADSPSAISISMAILAGCVLILTLAHLVTKIISND